MYFFKENRPNIAFHFFKYVRTNSEYRLCCIFLSTVCTLIYFILEGTNNPYRNILEIYYWQQKANISLLIQIQ